MDCFRNVSLRQEQKSLFNLQNFSENLHMVFSFQIFTKILEKNPEIVNKIEFIKGDVLEDSLGIMNDDRDHLISNVDIVFHCAANVRFDQPLRPMIEMNVLGTFKVLKLAEKMVNIKLFVHVSTSYCQVS